MNISYWEREYKTKYDLAIIGAGIIGLTTAIFYKQLNPFAKVLIIEQGVIPNGASTKNAGFACIGSLSELHMDGWQYCERSGIEDLAYQVAFRYSGIQKLLKLVGPNAIDYKQNGNCDVLTETTVLDNNGIEYWNKLLKEHANLDNVFRQIDVSKCFSNNVKACVFNQYEGELNSGKLYTILSDFAVKLGVEFKYGTKVLSIDEEVNTADYSFKFGKVAICCNAYTNNLLPEYNIKPGRGQVCIYSGLKLDINIPHHYNNGFYYFRKLDDGRLLIGGGRNKNFLAETTTNLINTKEILSSIDDVVRELFNENAFTDKTKVDYSWAGVMGFSESKKPIIEAVPNRKNVYIGFACNGIGVAIGAWAGEKLATLLTKG